MHTPCFDITLLAKQWLVSLKVTVKLIRIKKNPFLSHFTHLTYIPHYYPLIQITNISFCIKSMKEFSIEGVISKGLPCAYRWLSHHP